MLDKQASNYGRAFVLISTLILLTLSALLSGCSEDGGVTFPKMNPTELTTPIHIEPTATQVIDTDRTGTAGPAPVLTPSSVPDTGWVEIGQGLERRIIKLIDPASSETQALYILRVEPSNYRFNVGYKAGNPQSLVKWREETGAHIVVNGGFFTEDNEATGLIVTNNRAIGTTYEDFGGMLAIGDNGPYLQWLKQEPYDPEAPISAALQSFPMLVKPGGVIGYDEEDGERARRTVIGQDYDGRFLIIITPSATFSLAEMSRYLVDSDLDLDLALNLDGGASTGLLLAEPAEGIPAFVLLPSVILIYTR
jgi:uncharacterized protein YigE (DUF2233 family)